MKDKRTTIILEAMSLFSEQGFHATSIQEIADKSKVSKGTIYTYFSSKEDLLYSIFAFFYENMRVHVQKAIASDMDPRQKLEDQVYVLLYERWKYIGFFKMQYREQSLAYNPEIKQILFKMQIETFNWLESTLTEVYGPVIEPCLADCSLILETLTTSYLRVMIHGGKELDLKKTTAFIIRRFDVMITQLLESGDEGVLPKNYIKEMFARHLQEDGGPMTLSERLDQLKVLVEKLPMKAEKKGELEEAVQFLATEVEKDDPKTFVIKGVLSNFKAIDEVKPLAEKIEEQLGV